MEYPSLGGIIISLPQKMDADMFGESEYVFVVNAQCNIANEILKKLNNFSKTTISNWLTVNQIFVKKPSGQYISMQIPCIDCPEKKEIEIRRLPTI
jgi:hypothetical protein